MMAHDPLAVGTLISKIMQLSGPQGAIYTHRESLLLLLVDAHGAYAPAAAAMLLINPTQSALVAYLART